MQAQQAQSGAGYEFAQPPSAVPHKRAPYRDPYAYEEPKPVNIMHDPRVVRGNTYAAQVLPPSAQAEQELTQMRAEQARRRRAIASKRQTQTQAPPRTPEPVDGRRHMDVQTETFLEELTDRVPEETVGTQTEAFLDRPPTPLFMPAKTGDDKATQIMPGELFDFDLEVAPILEVLVGKTLEQGLMEVLEEEELAAIRRRQDEFEQLRNSELAEVQRLEGEVKRKVAEKQRRLDQERERARREAQVRQKIAAAKFARQYLTGLRRAVFADMTDAGHFYDPLTKEVEEQFMPWLMDKVKGRVDQHALAQNLTRGLIERSLELGQDRAEAYQKAVAERKAREEAERKAREEAEAEARRKAEEEAARKRAEEEAEEEED